MAKVTRTAITTTGADSSFASRDKRGKVLMVSLSYSSGSSAGTDVILSDYTTGENFLYIENSSVDGQFYPRASACDNSGNVIDASMNPRPHYIVNGLLAMDTEGQNTGIETTAEVYLEEF